VTRSTLVPPDTRAIALRLTGSSRAEGRGRAEQARWQDAKTTLTALSDAANNFRQNLTAA